MPDFTQLNVSINIGLFAAAAALVWLTGARIARYADIIARKHRLGHALVGIVLLAGVTSLPEIGVTMASSIAGDAKLAVNNLVGSIAMQLAVIALVDLLVSRRAMTAIVPDPSLLLLGTLNIILLAIVAAGIIVGDMAILGIGIWAWACLAAYLASVWVLSHATGRQPWLAARDGRVDEMERSGAAADNRKPADRQGAQMTRTYWATAAAAAMILAAGYVVAQTGSAIAQQTGLGSSFFGFALVAISTSLPEFSSALSAARLGNFTMAISDILGTNLINVGLIFAVDALADGEPALNRVGSFSAFGTILASTLVAIYVAGIAERRDIAFFRMGIDSLIVLLLYSGGLAILFTMR